MLHLGLDRMAHPLSLVRQEMRLEHLVAPELVVASVVGWGVVVEPESVESVVMLVPSSDLDRTVVCLVRHLGCVDGSAWN